MTRKGSKHQGPRGKEGVPLKKGYGHTWRQKERERKRERGERERIWNAGSNSWELSGILLKCCCLCRCNTCFVWINCHQNQYTLSDISKF